MRRAWRHRLAGPAASATALVLVLAGAAAVGVLVLGRVPDREERAVAFPVLAAVAVAAVAFGPVRGHLAAAAARAARGDRRPADEVVATFGERAGRGEPLDDLLGELVDALRRSLALDRAEVWLRSGHHLERVVSSPDAGPVAVRVGLEELTALGRVGTVGRAWLELWAPSLVADRSAGELRFAPATHAGVVLGVLVVERDDIDGPFDPAVDRSLGELGRRVGVLLRNRQLDDALATTLADLQRANEALRASRARLVAAADAERRRIERDIHDGAQHHLVALAVHLGLAAELAGDDDPAELITLIARLKTDVRDAVQTIRDLAHGIYPSVLVDAGLGDALATAARRSPNPVTVEAAGVGRFPTEAEAAVYFCCLEALQNAAKHAPAASVSIVAVREHTTLRVEVVDDGPGFDPGRAPRGHGLEGMDDRIGAVGGTLVVDAEPGRGARVVVTVPIAPDRRATVAG